MTGEQKVRLISGFIPHVKNMNLEEWECSQLDQLCAVVAATTTLPFCIFHRNLNPKHCTVHKVFASRKWFDDIFHDNLRADFFLKWKC